MKCFVIILLYFSLSVKCFTLPSWLSFSSWEDDRILEVDTSFDWWENGVFYQIYPRSFKDSNDDGIGDLQGIISKLNYLKELGVTGITLGPIFTSPNVDLGYDVSDYRNVDFNFGTKSDLNELFAKAKELDLKVILDMVPNHSSDQHPWFEQSVNRQNGFDNFYVWRSCSPDRIPNNWISEYNAPMWTYNSVRNQCYLHQYSSSQPDFMYRDNFENITREMLDVFTFWLNEGADGFRLHSTDKLVESGAFTRESPIDPNGDLTSYKNYENIYSRNYDESYDFIHAARKHVDDYSRQHGNVTRILMTEVFASIERVTKWYGEDWNSLGSHVPNNFAFISDIKSDTTASEYKHIVDDWMMNMPAHANGQGSWILSNHDRSRVSSRLGIERHKSMAIISMTLPGAALVYYGDEIGMTDNKDISWDDTIDIKARNTNSSVYKEFSRDPARTPMQWDETPFAGFCESCNRPWLPVNSNYQTINVKAQQEDSKSTLQFYKDLIKLRKEKVVLQKGGIGTASLGNEKVFAFKRTMSDYPTIAVLINLRGVNTRVNILDLLHPDDVSEKTRATILFTSNDEAYNVGSVVSDLSYIQIHGYDAVVFEISSASKLFRKLSLFIIFYNVFKFLC